MDSSASAFSPSSPLSCVESMVTVDPFVEATCANIAVLKADLSVAVTEALKAPDSEEKLKILEACRVKGELLRVLMSTVVDSNVVSAPSAPSSTRPAGQLSVVPSNLPLFQWEGHVFNAKAPIYVDVTACLQKFEDVMFSHNLNYDTNFKRLIPACLSTSQRTWYDQYLSSLGELRFQTLTWSMFKTAITEHYGLTVDEDRSSAAVALTDIEMARNESIDVFIDRFNNLRRRAVDQCPPASVLINKFLSALPSHLQDKVTVSKATLEKSRKNNIEVIISLVKDLSKELSRNRNKRASGDNGESSELLGSKRSKWASVPSSSSSSSSSASASASSSSRAPKQKRTPAPGTWCAFHKVNTHNTVDCRVASAASSALSSASSGSASVSSSPGHPRNANSTKAKSCYRCGVTPWTPQHQCNTARRINTDDVSDASRYLGALHLHQPADLISFAEDNDQQSSSDDTHMHDAAPEVQIMNAQQAQLCKYNKYSQLPPHKSNSILIPVIIESIKTFAVIDTGASFSIVSPSFVKFLGSSVAVLPSAGQIQLGHTDTKHQRHGHCFLNISYNNKYNVNVKLEIFDFFSDVKDVPLLFGLDILPKLNIGMTGLVSSWSDSTGPALPSPIDPEDIKPNESPFGLPSERQLMMSKLKPLLDANANIDLKTTYCDLPDSIVHLDTIPGKVAYRKQYPQPEAYRTAVLAQIDTWQKEGVIELAQCHTGFNSPLLCVSKKDADGVYTFKKPRVVADVRLLNSILISTDRFQFPMISDIHQKIGQSPIISSIDIHSCFTSFLVLPEHRHKLAFTCPYTGTQWMFRKVCFGISFMGNFTQRVLSNLFRDLPYVSVYVDDIQIATRAPLSYHTECVAEVLRRLTSANLQISPEKLVLAQKSIHILGWSIVNGQLIPDPRKVSNVHTWPLPTTGKQLMSYLGFMNYFRNSIPLYAMLSGPLDSIRNYKTLENVWTKQHTEAFNNLKLALASAPVISPPDFSCRLHVATDASLTGIGGIIYYIKNDIVHYVAMASRKLSSSEQNYSTTKRELLAVVYIFNKFHKWLFGIRFTLHTDHKSLIFLNHQSVPNMLMLNWYDTIFSYSFDVVHIPGCLNVIPNALSRLFSVEDHESSLEGGKINDNANKYKYKRKLPQKNLGNTIKPVTSRVIQNRYQKRNIHTVDSFRHISFSSFPTALKQLSHETNEYSDSNTYVRPKLGKNYTPLVNRSLQLAEYTTPPEKERVPIIMKAHLLGHFGINAIEKTIHNDYNFHWTNMRQDIQKVINDCVACQAHGIYKVGYHPPRSVLPDGVFDHICMDLGDFNTTSSSGNNFVLVVVDYFSRFTILRALPDKHSHTIAKELLSIFCLFGFPKIINSDNGSEFVNEIVTNLIEMSGIDRRLSLPYTPTSNPVAEKFVGTMKRTIIKTLTANGAAPSDWDLYLDPCQYAINAQYARLHKSRPFSVMYNRQPNGFQDYTNLRPSLSFERTDSRAIDDKLKFVKETVLPALAKRINETQSNDHNRFINSHKIVHEKYPINSKVMITNVNRTSKMTERWLGPYIITGYSPNGSYILKDLTGAPLPRHLPTQQIRLMQSGNKRNPGDFKEEHYEVQAIVNHRGTLGNYEYYVHWVGYDDQDKYNTWQTTDTFDSMKPIQDYWTRYNNTASGTSEHNLLPQIKRPRKIPARKYYSRSKAQRSVLPTGSKAERT